MSVQAMSWAYRVELLNPGDKFLLVTLANFADEWGVCWPGIDTLVQYTAQSERKVRNGLAALEEAGLIVSVARRRADGTRRTDVVVLVGFEGRRRALRPEDHAAVDLPAVERVAEARAKAAQDARDPVNNRVDNLVDNTINRHDVPVVVHASDQPSTGTSFHINRHVVPVHIRNEPSLEPSEEEEARGRARDPALDDTPDGHREGRDEGVGQASDERQAAQDSGCNGKANPAALVERICAALGHPDLVESRWWKIEADFGRRIASWREMGLDDATILLVARKFGREMPERPVGPKALDGAMARAAKRSSDAKKPARAKAATTAQPAALWPDGCKDLIEFFGRKIAAGKPVSPAAVSIPMAREMLARGLVTADDLRRRGIAA